MADLGGKRRRAKSSDSSARTFKEIRLSDKTASLNFWNRNAATPPTGFF